MTLFENEFKLGDFMNTSLVLDTLKKISDSSGKEFLDLSTHFPILVSELSFNKNSSEDAAHKEKIAQFEKIQAGLKDALVLQTDIIGKNRGVVENFRERNNELIDSFESRMDLLSKMNELIQIIKDESAEMELIALNAMVVSIKSGKDGQAFSYITSNLKTLSLKLISQSDALIENEKNIQDNIELLRNTINEIEALSSISVYEEQNQTQQAASQMADVIENIIASLKRMLARSSDVKAPIIKAMECIQMQDIIRQSLDDVILTASKIKEPGIYASVDEQLDQYSFNEQLFSVAVNLLGKIKERLVQSIEVFKQNQTEINRILQEIESERSAFISSSTSSTSEENDELANMQDNQFSAHGGDATNKKQTLESCIEQTTKDFSEFVSIFNSYQAAQEQVLEKSNDIQTAVGHIQICFNDFFPIINNLHYVAIAQRIEVARNENISSIESTVDYMANLIDKTNNNVQDAQTLLQTFIENSTKQIKLFSQEADADRKIFATINRTKSSFIRTLGKLQKRFDEAVKHFTVYSKDFLESYGAIELAIKNLETLANSLDEEKQMLFDMQEDTKNIINSLLAENNLTEWQIKNNSFNDFIHHFTIIDDKEMASSVTGIQIESGVEAGEITFF